MSVIKEKET